MIKIFLLTLFLVICGCDSRIAYVDSNRLMIEFTEAQKAQKKIQEKGDVWDAEVKMLQDSLDAYLTLFKSQVGKLSKKGIGKMQREYGKRGADLERYKTEKEKEGLKLNRELMGPVLTKINAYMKEYGKKNKYKLIFGTTSGGNIVYADDKVDVTGDVLKGINEKYKALSK